MSAGLRNSVQNEQRQAKSIANDFSPDLSDISIQRSGLQRQNKIKSKASKRSKTQARQHTIRVETQQNAQRRSNHSVQARLTATAQRPDPTAIPACPSCTDCNLRQRKTEQRRQTMKQEHCESTLRNRIIGCEHAKTALAIDLLTESDAPITTPLGILVPSGSTQSAIVRLLSDGTVTRTSNQKVRSARTNAKKG